MNRESTVRLVVLPDAPSTSALLKLLRALLAQRLIEPLTLISDDSLTAVTIQSTAINDVARPLKEVIETARCERFLVVNLVTADSIRLEDAGEPDASDSALQAGELARGLAVDMTIRNAMSRPMDPSETQQPTQHLQVVNLVAPAAKASSIPFRLHSQGPADSKNDSFWSNVVLAPETQESSAQAAVAISADSEYVANVGAALITMLGCWSGAPGEPEIAPWIDAGTWTIARTRSRSIIAPELPYRVLGRVGRSTSGHAPIDDEMTFSIADSSDYAIELALKEIIKRNGLTHRPFVNVEERPTQREISLIQFFRLVWAWLTRSLPALVVDEVKERVRDMGDRVDEHINARAGLDASSAFRIRLFGRKRKPSPKRIVDEGKEGGTRESWRFLAPEPELWSGLRATCFGLLDGGDVPFTALQELLGVGLQRFVLGDRTRISPPPDRPIWQPCERVASLGIGPVGIEHVVDIKWADAWEEALDRAVAELSASDVTEQSPEQGSLEAAELLAALNGDLARLRAARAAARESLLWALGEHLNQQRNEVFAQLESLKGQIDKAKEAAANVEAIEEKGKKDKRALLRRTLITVAILAVLGGLAYLGFKWLVGGVVVSILLGTVLVALWIFGLLRALWQCVKRWFAIEHHMYWQQQGELEVLQKAYEIEESLARRFEYLVRAEAEWADLIATTCWYPFRQDVTGASRTRDLDLGLPSSHQVIDGDTSDPRLDGLTSAVASRVIRKGWLASTYYSAFQYSTKEHELRTRGGSFEPDKDVTGRADAFSQRRNFVDAVISGRARLQEQIRVLRIIHTTIRTGAGFITIPGSTQQDPVNRLFTPWDSRFSPSDFLDQPGSGTPSNFNREFIYGDHHPSYTPTNRQSLREPEISLPDPPDTEEMITNGTSVEFPPLVFGAWAVETIDGVVADQLKFFGTVLEPAAINLSLVDELWGEPPDGFIGEIRSEVSEEERALWILNVKETQGREIRISPNPGSRPGVSRGPYSYLVEEDGEPLSHPMGVPIKFAVRRDCAPPGAITMICQALQCVSDRTGHEFVFAGTFDGLPSKRRGRIEIAWARNDEFQEWERSQGEVPSGRTLGWGGPETSLSEGSSGARILLGGMVLVNADMNYEIGFLPTPCHGSVLLHELGHVMNLAHVADQRQIMCPVISDLHQMALDYGPGDALGLRTLRDVAAHA